MQGACARLDVIAGCFTYIPSLYQDAVYNTVLRCVRSVFNFSSLQVRLSKCGPTYKIFQTYDKVDLAPNRKETKCQVWERLYVSVPSHWVQFCCRFIWNMRTTNLLYPGLSKWTTIPHSVTASKMSELPPQCQVTLTFFLVLPVPTPPVLHPSPWPFPWTQHPTH
jgi:hypothetical protein